MEATLGEHLDLSMCMGMCMGIAMGMAMVMAMVRWATYRQMKGLTLAHRLIHTWLIHSRGLTAAFTAAFTAAVTRGTGLQWDMRPSRGMLQHRTGDTHHPPPSHPPPTHPPPTHPPPSEVIAPRSPPPPPLHAHHRPKRHRQPERHRRRGASRQPRVFRQPHVFRRPRVFRQSRQPGAPGAARGAMFRQPRRPRPVALTRFIQTAPGSRVQGPGAVIQTAPAPSSRVPTVYTPFMRSGSGSKRCG